MRGGHSAACDATNAVCHCLHDMHALLTAVAAPPLMCPVCATAAAVAVTESALCPLVAAVQEQHRTVVVPQRTDRARLRRSLSSHSRLSNS